VAQALQLGVSGYVLKDSFVDELPVLIRAVTRGETYLSPGISKQVVEVLKSRLSGAAPDADLLTPRQREILQLVAEGKSTKEIAASLDLSVKTVETHRAQIMNRLQIRDVPGLVRYAIRMGLVSA
jgi:DNA-binding NarL/FixJ family response regulator